MSKLLILSTKYYPQESSLTLTPPSLGRTRPPSLCLVHPVANSRRRVRVCVLCVTL